MCGIVGAIAERDVTPILIEGLRRLEYRGYDSAGVALLRDDGIDRVRCVGKVQALVDKMGAAPPRGVLGIAHTRWATHGVPAEENAHPMVSRGRLALVHNGIIEDHERLKAELADAGYAFDSATDTEVLSHAIHRALEAKGDLFDAVESVVHGLDGAYAIAAVDQHHRDALVVARRGTPLVIGIGIGEHFVASDIAALLAVTRRFIFLEEGDIARVTRGGVEIRDLHGKPVTRPVTESALDPDAA
ncbi:MAG: glutamine--fructose-6-phosphate aminotransferase, partial [Abyssibacter sp.]|nr:glutamine--fructose-6-phosphate aminotransferase [Abyssibacter sp.]